MTYADAIEVDERHNENDNCYNPFTVQVHDVKVLNPIEPTEKATLYLSNIDLLLVQPIDTFFVYAPNEERDTESLFAVLEEAFLKLLVPYHFMAGRIEESEEGRLQLKCNRAGAGFVTASSPQTLADIGDLRVMNPDFRKLMPAPKGVQGVMNDEFLLRVQVTRFRCGGFTVGFRMNHAMCDGVSTTLLFRSFCALARGEALTTFPDPDRTILAPREPPTPEFPHSECFKLSELPSVIAHKTPALGPEYTTKHIPLSQIEIETLKAITMADGNITKCSSFEAVIAHFWRSRTRCLDFAPEEISNILIAVDFRTRIQPPIPPTFCGNSIISAHVSAPAGEILQEPLSFCVDKIQQAVARINERYVRSAIDWLQIHKGLPAVRTTKDCLVSAWWKIPFYEHDYGWGKPVHSGPPFPGTSEYVLIVTDPAEDGGLLLLVTLLPHEMVKFNKYFKDISSGSNSGT
ncbi:acyltransferase GLAUCE [Physcomitrium patens]|uniref:BAHD family acyltransferase, clade V n=1 Tax=Physcomitrium patens TaxID=3218 RepID=A0A2K1IGE6_PHYPA|nr:shikimate O-hydroxycinnamoyltransferase-like [Physcomitrium patens]PNR28347.1 hypothetical protein PHYPA_028939 [Physcomitrium patens]|eukprot:XP_024363645.1 shikimate O-hydroxycinnamoyltransferase-like [Physcomitrella patens]